MSSSKPLSGQRGFTYLGLLFALALLGLALGAAGTVWSVVRQRDREQQLLWVGGEIRRAIGHYYQAGPGGLRAFPRSLQDLTADERGAVLIRHLRQAYPDPMTPTGEWELIRGSDGALIGVASKAKGTPMKQKGFAEADRAFEDAGCYCDWRFVYLPQLQQRPGKAGNTPFGAPSGSTPASGLSRREVGEVARGLTPAR